MQYAKRKRFVSRNTTNISIKQNAAKVLHDRIIQLDQHFSAAISTIGYFPRELKLLSQPDKIFPSNSLLSSFLHANKNKKCNKKNKFLYLSASLPPLETKREKGKTFWQFCPNFVNF